MNVFSFSRLNLYETCPYRFYKKYVEGFDEPETYPLALGKGVHKAVEEKLQGTEHNVAVEIGMLEANYHPEVTRKELSWLTANAPIHQVFGEVELHFKLPLSDEPDAPMIQGYIDVVGDGYIIDWKTNRVAYNVRDNYQLMLYAWAMNQLYGWHEVSSSLYFLRFKEPRTELFGLTDMEEAREWAYSLAREIQAKLSVVEAMPELKYELFPATPQSFCSHCPFSYDCFSNFSTFVV